MAAITAPPQLSIPNRRRRVRHRILTPAYACFRSDDSGSMLDLHEIIDINEDGISIQCHDPLPLDSRVDLCLDLADCPDQIYTTGHVIWTNHSGRAGLRFTTLSADSLARLREWLFVNVMAGVANSEIDLTRLDSRSHTPTRPSYSDTLAAVTAVQRQVDALGSDLSRSLQFIAESAQALVRASGTAIALADTIPDFMICRASSGADAPPVGSRLQVGSGFSGECVKRGLPLRCDDAERDTRVDRESCRALGIRSILAVPIRSGEESVGLLEAFSAQPAAFSDSDVTVLQRLADTILNATRAQNPPKGASSSTEHFSPAGSFLFASADAEAQSAIDKDEEILSEHEDEKSAAALSLPRTHLIILVCAAATIAMVLGYQAAATPWIQTSALPWIQNKLHSRDRAQLQTVLASSQAPKPDNSASPSIETATIDQLRQMADKGDPAAQNALGLRYATGEGLSLNEVEAVRWFTLAAEKGYVPAQSKLGSLYYSGRGVPQDPNRAYFWMVVARYNGDDASKTLSPFVRARLTRPQVTSIELEADRWLQQHSATKPVAGQLKAKY
ncbi:MAG TPA: GAF domain-containing protein [Candidatus Sulfotelmatobacter sp.]|nr:GAF domain-containing protein [Candidatus Sulfotelmatobacter sp.]